MSDEVGKGQALAWIAWMREAQEAKMKQSKFPIGWDEERIHRVLAHYEKQTEERQWRRTKRHLKIKRKL